MDINCELPGDQPLKLSGVFTFDYGIGETHIRSATTVGTQPNTRPVKRELMPGVTGAQLLEMAKKDYRSIYGSDPAFMWIYINEQTNKITFAQAPGSEHLGTNGR